MRYSTFIFFCITLSFVVSNRSLALKSEDASIALSAFEKQLRVETRVTLPTVVEVPVTDPAFRLHDAVVYEETSKTFQPYRTIDRHDFLKNQVLVTSDLNPISGNLSALTDGDGDTMTEFPLSEDTESRVELRFRFSKPTALSGLSFSFDQFVAYPRSIAVMIPNASGDIASMRTVLAQSAVSGRTIRFPKVTTDTLVVKVWYGQPLRIREISFFEDAVEVSRESVVRFLARPSEQYVLYAHSDRGYIAPVGESADLMDNRDIQKITGGSLQTNPFYRPGDIDKDGIIDRLDNCIKVNNDDQRDENSNGRGDACDDYDKDEVINSLDNCLAYPNRGQIDTDHDGQGDACDNEESRVTEKYVWMPWAAVLLGIIIVGGLFVSVIRRSAKDTHV